MLAQVPHHEPGTSDALRHHVYRPVEGPPPPPQGPSTVVLTGLAVAEFRALQEGQ
jgi:hypothetical protein